MTYPLNSVTDLNWLFSDHDHGPDVHVYNGLDRPNLDEPQMVPIASNLPGALHPSSSGTFSPIDVHYSRPKQFQHQPGERLKLDCSAFTISDCIWAKSAEICQYFEEKTQIGTRQAHKGHFFSYYAVGATPNTG